MRPEQFSNAISDAAERAQMAAMKKRTVITTEKREIWVVREGSPDPGPPNEPDAMTISPPNETEDPETEETERNEEP